MNYIMFDSKFIEFPIRKFYIKAMIKLYQLIVAQWCYMATQISINISSGNGLLLNCTKPLLLISEYLEVTLFKIIAGSHFYAMEYWPGLSEL